ncbi:glucosamine-6-phosphate deaminase [Ornithinimicrobium ciconiae]|uniref:Glucosamine-6-phosphate deaminase n=1 Tax=Ornithinimicrobium ciconiae TaxID=2594265 RepID=A0A516G9M0_9MICO|nr:glucosamine-6-phosphate deaminase [Ornithinimicrobium ciconiae]QDO88226.1 glucosamine-6-phosphate deaminase [Ornithinimicrobium ciconiae]
MEVIVTDTPQLAGNLVATILQRWVRPGGTLGLATGSSPEQTYAELVRRHREEGLSFEGVRAFLLDEYVGLGADHPQSYRQVIQQMLTDQVGLDITGPDGMARDLLAEAAAYEERIREAGGIDVQLLGIGGDGHLGFNEPGSSLNSRTRVKTLTTRTRRDNARFFADDQVPHHVLTQGLATIREARHLVLIATGEGKAAAVAAAVEGPLSAFCPASVLQLHPHVSVVLDRLSAAQLERVDYYRFAHDHKPDWQDY